MSLPDSYYWVLCLCAWLYRVQGGEIDRQVPFWRSFWPLISYFDLG